MEATQYDRVSEVANVNQYASIAAFSTPPDNYDRVSTIDPSVNGSMGSGQTAEYIDITFPSDNNGYDQIPQSPDHYVNLPANAPL